MPASRRPYLAAIGAALAVITAILAFAVPADAAAGVEGRLNSAVVVQTDVTCTFQGPCQNYFTMKATGWAYNQRTRPVQEVYLQFTGTGVSQPSNVIVANRTRNDAQRQFGLHTAQVGFVLNESLLGDWYGTGGTACAYARDHNTNQAWRKIGCTSYRVTD